VIRLHFVVEGQSEETFVNQLLAPELAERATIVDVRRITTGRKRGVPHRGGFVAYEQLRNDLSLWMKQERRNAEVRFTTMIDLYGLPWDFPGKLECQKIHDPFDRVAALESKFRDDLSDQRLIPYIQLHEFEALLFSDLDAFLSAFPANHAEIEQLKQIRKMFESPEHIDDGQETAPSKRICRIFPGYAKTSFGLVIAKTIRLSRMRAECKHFDNWIESLHHL
jgi:hypothetical protein